MIGTPELVDMLGNVRISDNKDKKIVYEEVTTFYLAHYFFKKKVSKFYFFFKKKINLASFRFTNNKWN